MGDTSSWRPKFKGWPLSWIGALKKICDRIDAITPMQGTGGIKVSDIPGGKGKDISTNPVGASGVMPHNYTVKNASTGNQAAITVTLGNHIDATNNATWIPTINGQTLDTIPTPVLNVGNDDTVVYFKLTVNPLDSSGALPAGQINAIEIDSGVDTPGADNTTLYQNVANITVTPGSTAVVISNEGGVSGSQVYQPCGGGGLFGLQ